MGAVIGDALGSPLEGLSKGHIRSVFGDIDGYVDPEPALKNRMDRWRKPALYSSLSQMGILVALSILHSGKNPQNGVLRIAGHMPEAEGGEWGILRHPGNMEKTFLGRSRLASPPDVRPFSAPCARIVPVLTPGALLEHSPADTLSGRLALSSLFNADGLAVAAFLIFAAVMERLGAAEEPSTAPGSCALALDEIPLLVKGVEERSGFALDHGINPETLLGSLGLFLTVFRDLNHPGDYGGLEKRICSLINRTLKTSFTRATVNHPLALIPYALLSFDLFRSRPGEYLFRAVSEGGSSDILGCLAGSLCGALHGASWLPPELVRNLVNRRRMLLVIDHIAAHRPPAALLDEFMTAEASLSAKEREEHGARTRHRQPRAKKPAGRGDGDRALTRHVIESWTKLDKARWKKTRKKIEPDEEFTE